MPQRILSRQNNNATATTTSSTTPTSPTTTTLIATTTTTFAVECSPVPVARREDAKGQAVEESLRGICQLPPEFEKIRTLKKKI